MQLSLSRSNQLTLLTTAALKLALKASGYSECYHMDTMWENCHTDPKQWTAALEAKFEGKGVLFRQDDWDRLLGKYQAVCDERCAAFANELMAAYPEAQVILTVRDSAEQ